MMIKLKDVSKYYYNKGIITSGFSKLSTEFKIGEFVVITGESGSGKSTLLNVISGLDSYEEGEMYINGLETSHYSEEDYEIYRKTYISNIFQNFNLINSYSVYQNIELILLINGYKRHDIKKKIMDIIKQVDLYKYRKTKVSKLSGGQKQRVAIARALAQNTPIILADEPTGNLDKKSAESVIKILKEVSKDKLVIVVTHNYEYLEEYATRKITMFDGKIIEDKELVKHNGKEESVYSSDFGKMNLLSKIRLGIRNTFNIIPKFLLLLTVFLFICLAITLESASFKYSKYNEENIDNSSIVNNKQSNRIIFAKKDKSIITADDLAEVGKIDNIKSVVDNDVELDNYINLSNDNNYFYGSLLNIDLFEGVLAFGRLPENDNELLLVTNEDNYYIQSDDILTQKFDCLFGRDTQIRFTDFVITGVAYGSNNMFEDEFFGAKSLLERVDEYYSSFYSVTNTYINNKKINYIDVIYSDNILDDQAYLSEQAYNDNYNYLTNKINVKVNSDSLYFNNSIELNNVKKLTKSTFKTLSNNFYDEYATYLVVSKNNYEKLYSKDIYQSSVLVDNKYKIDDTASQLEKLGYTTYVLNNMHRNSNYIYLLNIISLIITIILFVVLFFISYLIIKLILKSRHIYFSTIRILGASKNNAKTIIRTELFLVFNIAFIIVLFLIYLINNGFINSDLIKNMLLFMTLKDYVLLYIVLFIMTNLISYKYSKYIFKKSAISTLGGE